MDTLTTQPYQTAIVSMYSTRISMVASEGAAQGETNHNNGKIECPAISKNRHCRIRAT